MQNDNIESINTRSKPEALDKAVYWASIIDEWQSSGRPQQIFCKEKGISFARFGYWRNRLRKSKNEKSPSMIPVRVAHQNQLPCAGLHLKLPTGVQLNIPDGYSEQMLKCVIKLLGVWPC